jgi:hypothetical protein
VALSLTRDTIAQVDDVVRELGLNRAPTVVVPSGASIAEAWKVPLLLVSLALLVAKVRTKATNEHGGKSTNAMVTWPLFAAVTQVLAHTKSLSAPLEQPGGGYHGIVDMYVNRAVACEGVAS